MRPTSHMRSYASVVPEHCWLKPEVQQLEENSYSPRSAPTMNRLLKPAINLFFPCSVALVDDTQEEPYSRSELASTLAQSQEGMVNPHSRKSFSPVLRMVPTF
ncbi:hypothetical protein M758_11G088100 [Ceratodon purpureus]|uniref:Uncharacterized protein n=1 Tax=Ceratodon purpureus TaxID=3225 RepID=A0A8T0GCL4_CERPU|nr:hypothetical protein KC19_11G091200 [Ceratodon purpureus]KAG0601155.1 hypothetical protein M758_11G088100 [Ceratodon purpureus]